MSGSSNGKVETEVFRYVLMTRILEVRINLSYMPFMDAHQDISVLR